jgi:hypothetical protein
VGQSRDPPSKLSSAFHIIPKQEGSDLAIALWRLSNHTLRACNEHFVELVEYPTSILAYNFAWPELHKNLELIPDTPVKRVLVNSANTLQLMIESIIFGRTKFGKARLAFLTLPGRLKFATIELAAVHDSYNNPIEVLWLMKETEGNLQMPPQQPQAPPQQQQQQQVHPSMAYPYSAAPHLAPAPQQSVRAPYLDQAQPPFTPLVVSNSPPTPLSSQTMAAMSVTGSMPVNPYGYPPMMPQEHQQPLPPQYHMSAPDYHRPAASMPAVLPTESRAGAAPYPPQKTRKNSMPPSGPFQLTEIKTIRKNAAKRPWDQQSAKFSMRPPPPPPAGSSGSP